jgi:hypothetical protein
MLKKLIISPAISHVPIIPRVTIEIGKRRRENGKVYTVIRE